MINVATQPMGSPSYGYCDVKPREIAQHCLAGIDIPGQHRIDPLTP
jgi:hypothetical protein